MSDWEEYEECLARELAEVSTGRDWEDLSGGEKETWIGAWLCIRDEWVMRMREAAAIIADAAKKNTEEENNV